MAEALLALQGVRAGYGDAVVLENLSLEVHAGQSVSVLGRNGVGKTTLLLTIMGFTTLVRGSVLWHGEDITRLGAHLRPRRGLGWVPQERELFSSLTVEENLTVAARPGRFTLEAAFTLFPRLAERRAARASRLSGGEQQMAAIARALMTNPSLLLLDEPLEGLAPILVDELVLAIRRLTADQAMTMVLVEQHADLALELTQEAVVLDRGTIVHRGPSHELPREGAALDRLIGLRPPGPSKLS